MGSQAQVTELLVTKYEIDPSRVRPDATMAELGFDSLAVVELAFDIEDIFSITIPQEEATFDTLGEAVALIDRLVDAGRG